MKTTTQRIVAALLSELANGDGIDDAIAGELGCDELDAPVDRETVRELSELYPGAGDGVVFDVVREDGSRATVELSVRVTEQPRLSRQGMTPRERELEERDAALLAPLHRRPGHVEAVTEKWTRKIFGGDES